MTEQLNINQNETLNFANDAGNDSLKAFMNDEYFEMPSVIAIKGPQNTIAPVSFNNQQDKDKYMNDFLDHMDVSISSNAVNEGRRFLVGRNAVSSTMPLTSFDLNDLSGKSEVDLTPLLTLSVIAGYRIKLAYKSGESLNDPLKVTVNMTTALPISEGKQPNKINHYRDRYLKSTHVVTFHNFKDPITVQIKFKHVYVGLEGETAQLAISNHLSDELGDQILYQLKEDYPKVANQLTVNTLTTLIKSSLGIDIGGKTTDYVVINNGQTNLNASNSMMQGYDNVLEKARLFLQTKQFNFENISQLQQYLSSEAQSLFSNNKEVVQKAVADEADSLSSQIVNHVSSTVRQVGPAIKLAFVYGGGSIALSDTSLKADISHKLSNFNGGSAIPVIWIPKEFAQKLNLFGLQMILKALMAEN